MNALTLKKLNKKIDRVAFGILIIILILFLIILWWFNMRNGHVVEYHHEADNTNTSSVLMEGSTGIPKIINNMLVGPANTDDLPEGQVNLYFTEARAQAVSQNVFWSLVPQLTTDQIHEGSFNKYFHDYLVYNALSATDPILFNSNTGQLSLKQSGITSYYIADNTILPSNMATINTEQDGWVLRYDSASGQFEWVSPAILSSETVTNMINQVPGHKIADYTNENGTIQSINETVTGMTNQVSGHKIADYVDENGNNQPINETITSLSLSGTTLTYTDEAGSVTNLTLPTASALWDADIDTGIQVEATPDEDFIHEYTAGVQRSVVDNNGNVLWADSTPADLTNPGSISGLFYNHAKIALRLGFSDNNEWDDVNVGMGSFSSGQNNIVSGNYSSALGGSNNINDVYSVALGRFNNISSSYSVAGGYYNTASGYASAVFGQSNSVSGRRAMSWGMGNTASADYATAFGNNTVASATYATSFGNTTQASGAYSTAFGYHTTASGAYSMAFGRQSGASGDYATAFGNRNTASGYGSTAFGYRTTASGSYSLASGYYSEASGRNAVALNDTTANSYMMTAIGRFNVVDSNQDPNNWVDSDYLFVVGNGTSWNTSDRHNAFSIYKNGRLVIDAPADQALLVNNPSGTVGGAIATVSYVNSHVGTSIFDADADTGIQVEANPDEDMVRFSTRGTERFLIDEQGHMRLADNPASQPRQALFEVGKGSESSTFAVSGDPSYLNIATFRDKDGENVFRAQGSLSNDDLIVTFGDWDWAYDHFAFGLNAATDSFDFYYGDIRLHERTGANTHFVGFRAPDSVASSVVWTLPGQDGGNGYLLQTNGAGVLSWIDASTLTLGSIDNHSDVDTSTNPPANGQVLKWNGTNWVPADDIDTDTLATLSCANGQVAKWNGSSWACADDIDTNTDTLATLACSNGQIAKWNSSSGQWECSNDNDSDTLANLSCSNGQVAKWDGSNWVCANDDVNDSDTDSTNELNTSLSFDTSNNTLSVTDAGGTLSADLSSLHDVYNAGNGLSLASNTFSINAPTCNAGEVLTWDGTQFTCVTDQNTTYTAGNGLQLNATEFSINAPTCGAGEVLTWNGNQFTCVTDSDTTYTAGGTLLQLSGTTFSIKEGTLTNGDLCTYDSSNGLVCNTDASTVGTDNQNLSWDATNDRLTISSGNTVDLSDLTQTLSLSGTTLSISSGNSVNFTNWDTDVTDDVSLLNDLQDVSLTSPASGESFVFDGTNWVNKMLNFIDLADTPSDYGNNGEVLQTDGAGGLTWVDPSSLHVVNLYNSDGTLSGARNVDLNGNNLVFSGSGNIGIGTTSPSNKLQVNGNVRATRFVSSNGTASSPAFRFSSDTNTGMFLPAADTLAFTTNGSERFRINQDGLLTYGTDVTDFNVLNIGTVHSRFLVQQESTDASGYGVGTWADNDTPARLTFIKARGNISSPTAVQVDDEIAQLSTIAYDGSQYVATGGIRMIVDGAVSNGAVPSRMEFTLNGGGGGDYVAMTLKSSGNVGIGTSSPTHLLDVSGDVRFRQQFYDSDDALGTAGQVLTADSNGYVHWKNPVSCVMGGAKVADDGSIINSYGNIASVSHTNTGRYNVYFTNSLNTDDYYVHLSKEQPANTRDDINIDVASYASDHVFIIIHEGDNGTSADTYRDRAFSITVFDANCTALSEAGNLSDARLKTNITTIDNALSLIGKLRGVRYNWNTDKYPNKPGLDNKPEIGLIAQEVKEVVPEVVNQGDDGYYRIEYGKLTGLLVEGIKSQQTEINQIRKTTKINSQFNGLVSRILGLEDKLASLQYQAQTEPSNQNQSNSSTPIANTDNSDGGNNVGSQTNADNSINQDEASGTDSITKLVKIINDVWHFISKIVFDKEVIFNGMVTFAKDISIKGKVEFTDSDVAGYAVINKGTDKVHVSFEKPYKNTPIVTATLLTPTTNGIYYISNISKNGFDIVVNEPATSDIKFSWVAVLVKDPQVTYSSPTVTPTNVTPTVITTTPTPTDTPTPTPTPEPTASATPTPSPTITITPTSSPAPSDTPTPTPSE